MKAQSKVYLSLLSLMVSFTIVPIPSANAAWLQYQTSPADTYNRPELLPEFDITSVSFGVSDVSPDEYWFFLNFAKPVSANLFADGNDSWAGVFLDINNDGKEDYSLETKSTPYESNIYQKGDFLDRSSGSPVFSTKCQPQTWTNLEKQATWIGFSIKKNCLNMASTIGVRGYSDHIAKDSSGYDYAPDSYWVMDINGGAITPSGNSSSSTIIGQLPTVNNLGSSIVTSPSNQPNDLVSLAAATTKSVVTVLCGNGIGSGWSINATLSSTNISSGYKSYVISNHHVIAKCTLNRNVTLVLSDQSRVSGYVYAWDEASDVAGILTSTYIPPLDWRGATPQQGWWVGVLGSPLGFPGILTTGIVSSVNATTLLGTTNAAINPGNSGGPVFDRNGRVIGLATAKYVNAEGFGIFHGTPLLCLKIVACANSSQIWQGISTTTPTPTPTPTVDLALQDALKASKNGVDAAQDAIDGYSNERDDCLGISEKFNVKVQEVFDSTNLGEHCNQLESKAEKIQSRIDAIKDNILTSIKSVDAANRSTTESNNLVEEADKLKVEIQDFADELFLLNSNFLKIVEKRENLNLIEESIIDKWSQLADRITILPLTLQKSFKNSSDYKLSGKIFSQVTRVWKLKVALDEQLVLISRPNLVTNFTKMYLALNIKTSDLALFKKAMVELNRTIPSFVCQKGTTTFSASKSGVCAKGFEKIPTT